jgi:hypothetical protein
MRAQKEKSVSTIDEEIRKEKRSKINRILASILVAIAVWVAAIYAANSIINESRHIQVYRVKQNMVSGTKITQGNAGEYLEKCSMAEDSLPEGYVTDESVLYNTFTNRDYVAKEIITTHGVKSKQSMVENIENPVELSVAVSSIDAAVGGILREGDFINIYSVANNSTATLIMNNAYVTKALDSSGKEILRSDKQSTATVINLLVPVSIESQFNKELMAGTVRMSLVHGDGYDKAVEQEEPEESSEQYNEEQAGSEQGNESTWVGDLEDVEDSEVK